MASAQGNIYLFSVFHFTLPTGLWNWEGWEKYADSALAPPPGIAMELGT